MTFRGTFDHTLDAKNRLTVPARFRVALGAGVVLAKGVEPCVAIWTPAAYEAQTAAALLGRNPLSPEARQLSRYFSANAIDIELDKAGRVMLAAFLMEHANLEREVVVTGAGECLEVWNQSAWTAYNNDLSARIPDIAAGLDRAS
ncbi:MAG: division/cell wall cluster transcriptional repressor MraZ [Solirubrobacterales bacterium]|nr:division/cell wall cluster transcriptional repressor MraZ [Solirubrobacterales bacterium]